MQVSAVFAADAVARLSRTVGVAAVTAGPGVTNTVTAVKNAQLAESPILLIGTKFFFHYEQALKFWC
jgi:acetolactate synthase-like protein